MTEAEEENYEEQWWIASLGDALVWARLRVLESGVAEVFNAEGEVLRYDDEELLPLMTEKHSMRH